MDFKTKYNIWLELINDNLDKYVPEKECPEKSLYSAMKYSLMAGGKRLRPVLALAVCDMLDGDIYEAMPFACAIEMIHTYSLIHDDLPAMDNDDYRRGRLTNHKVFGEAKAILAGDGLLNYAFEIMLAHTAKDTVNIVAKVNAMEIIASASGTSGMIAGQVVDLDSEEKEISSEMLEYMHRCKTGALIKAPVLAAAVLCNANREQYDILEQYSECLGLAFQIKDDILDVEGNLEIMGKNNGSDAQKGKSTFVSLYGLNESKKMLEEVTNRAINNINQFGDKGQFLKDLSLYLLNRTH